MDYKSFVYKLTWTFLHPVLRSVEETPGTSKRHNSQRQINSKTDLDLQSENCVQESLNKRRALAITAHDNALTIKRPIEVIDGPWQSPDLKLQSMLLVAGPDAHLSRRIPGRNPLPVWRKLRHRRRVCMLPVDFHIQRIGKTADDHRSAITVHNGSRFRVPRDEDSSPSFRARCARVSFQQFRHP